MVLSVVGICRHIMASGAAEKILFALRWYGGMISTNLEVIWEMSVNSFLVLRRGLDPPGPSIASPVAEPNDNNDKT